MDLAARATRRIPLADLPHWSPWPARLLGLAPWTAPKRTIDKVDREYDKEKYQRCLAFAQHSGRSITPREVRAFEMNLETLHSVCVSHRGTLYELPANTILQVNAEVLADAVAPFLDHVETVVELGCGYGINLWELSQRWPDRTYVGGEYSRNAVALASLLYAPQGAISVHPFNLYDSHYPLIDNSARGKRILIFTRHAIEQLPRAERVIETLMEHRDRIHAVIHLEMIHDSAATDLLGIMRTRFVELNDYNRDLLDALRRRPDVEILRQDPDVFGLNPLNPTGVLVWRPT